MQTRNQRKRQSPSDDPVVPPEHSSRPGKRIKSGHQPPPSPSSPQQHLKGCLPTPVNSFDSGPLMDSSPPIASSVGPQAGEISNQASTLEPQPLTQENLRVFQKSFPPPGDNAPRLDEPFNDNHTTPPSAPSVYLANMTSRGVSVVQSSTGVSGSGRKSSVHKTTKRFSDEMQSEFGYLNYKYNRSWPDYKKPSNITEIMTMLAKDRNDNPTVEDWDAYCDFANISLLELAIRSYTTEFLGFREIDGIDRSVPTAWTTAGLLPGKQLLMTPDFCCGIQSDALGILQRPWVNSVLPGFVTDESVLWVNGIIECKAPASSDMYQARVQARMAAALATLHWHRFSERVLDKPIQTGYASVASFCFDGNVIEAAVYWLEPSLQPKKRVYDVHSMRIAAGHAFATSLDEFVAVRRKFRNVFDWLQKAREDRYKAILELPEDAPADRRKVMLPVELNAVASPVQPEGDKPQAITVNLPDRAQPRSQGAGEEDEEEEDEEEAMLADSSTGLSQQAGGLGLDGADGRTGPGARAGPSGGDTASRTTKSSGKRRGPSNASKDQRSKRGRP